MKKRLITMFLVSAMTVAMLAGCSSSSSSSSSDASATEASTREVSVADTSTAEAQGSKVVEPQDSVSDVNNLEEGTYHVAFAAKDVVEEDGSIVIKNATIFTEDAYDIVDIGTLAVGDTIVSEGKEIPVESIEEDKYGDKLINGGFEEGGVTLVTEEDTNGWFGQTDNDLRCYTEAGTTDLKVSKDVAYEDDSDLDNKVTAGYDDLLSKMDESYSDFDEYNTTIDVENGEVVAINKIYTP